MIAVRFSSRQYEATEISEAMEVGIDLVRGTSDEPVNVIVRLGSLTATGTHASCVLKVTGTVNYFSWR